MHYPEKINIIFQHARFLHSVLFLVTITNTCAMFLKMHCILFSNLNKFYTYISPPPPQKKF